MPNILLMDQKHIQRTIKRLSIQVWEQLRNNTELVIFGLNDRGFATAKLLYGFLQTVSNQNISLYRYNTLDIDQSELFPNCNEKIVLLVDDVIFSGKTMFSALSTICNLNEPTKIEVLSLVDRGHRTYPILSSLTGISVPTKFGEHIEVILENQQLYEVVLFNNS